MVLAVNHAGRCNTPSWTSVTHKPSKTFGDLANVCAKRSSVRVNYSFLERFEDATCGLKPQSLIAIFPYYVTQVRYNVMFTFNAKGTPFTYCLNPGKGQSWSCSRGFLEPTRLTRRRGRVMFSLSWAPYPVIYPSPVLSPPGIYME